MASDTLHIPEHIYPASEIQKMFWLTNQIHPENPAYNIASIFSIKGFIDHNILAKSINFVVSRHDVLNAGFRYENDDLIQFTKKENYMNLAYQDLSDESDAVKKNKINTILEEVVNRKFNLESPPLIRSLLIRFSEDEFILSIVIHHIIFDLESKEIFARELSEAYSFFSGKTSAIPDGIIKQYARYSLKQKDIVALGNYENAAAFWRESLNGQSGILNLPCDFPRPAAVTAKGNQQYFSINSELVNKLRILSKTCSVNLFATMLAVYYILLYRLSQQEDIIIGVPLTNRRSDECKGVIGCFVNILPLALRLNGVQSFHDIIKMVRKALLNAHRNQEIPFSLIVKSAGLKRNPAFNPIYQAGFTFEHPMKLNFSDVEIQNIFTKRNGSQLDIFMTLWESGDEVRGYLEYSTDLFSSESAARMIRCYKQLIDVVLHNPGEKIDNLRMLSDEDENKILHNWNNTERDYNLSMPLHHHFEIQAEKTPGRTALKFRGQTVTYGELNEKSNILAHKLQSLGLGPDLLAGVYMERSIEMVIALYAILKAGGAYLPINPELPEARIRFILEDAEPVIIITQEYLKSRLPDCGIRIISVDPELTTLNNSMTDNPYSAVNCENLAYCIYTSGSTGKPKGALISHKSICNRLLWMQEYFNINEDDRILQKTPFDFDVSVWEFFWPLMTGATLVIAEPGGHRDSGYLAHVISSEQITVIHFVPAMLEIFLFDPEISLCTTLRYVICSGEALHCSLQEQFFSIFNCDLYNLYGPTETAVDVTYWKCSMNYEKKTVPIGYPVANTRIYILNSRLLPVPPGVEGDLYIGGVQLAKGYLNREELTGERFIPDPFSSLKNARMYKTGDIARWLSDGAIEYLGRSDFQVKFNGVRIETGEIEYALCLHPSISGAVVTLFGERGEKKLAAYYILKPGKSCSAAELRNNLKKILPAVMIPSYFTEVTSFPKTSSGKVDRKALPVPSEQNTQQETAQVNLDKMQQLIMSLWKTHLKRKNIGSNDNFFDLGGHSLLLTLINHALRRETGINISMTEMFQYPTISLLAEHLGKMNHPKESATVSTDNRIKKQREAILRMRRKN
ncbi:MAG TPA: amino acid adenylation domain-containing protein [Spirochaetota bacterium]|nr:amino acid adenylation domain-containing protein [Spirochaetota bacterium]